MEFPIYINDSIKGRLKIYKEGLYTYIEAQAEAGELLRLYLKGRDKNFPLGLMEPKGERAVFFKKFSKIQSRELPGEIKGAFALPYREKPRNLRPAPAAEKKDKNPIWTPISDGCLLGCIKEQKYLAIPSKIQGKIYGIRRIKYKKREYIVFRY